MAIMTKDLMLRNVPAETVKALKRAGVELDQPMGQVFAGLVDRLLGLYLAMNRPPEDLTPEESEALMKTIEEMARARYITWEDLKRELELGRAV